MISAKITSPIMKKGVITILYKINDIRFAYHWTKAEKALKNGDNVKVEKHKKKMNELLLRK